MHASTFPASWRAALAALLLASGALRAEDTDVVNKMSAARVERIMRGFSDVSNFRELGDGAYGFETANLKVIIFNKGETMQLFASFAGEATLTRLNEWNRDKRFAKAYLSKKGSPCLEADLELTGGVTEKNIKEWMKTYIFLLKEFKKHLEE